MREGLVQLPAQTKDPWERREPNACRGVLAKEAQAACPLCGKSSSDGKEHKECMDREAALADREGAEGSAE